MELNSLYFEAHLNILHNPLNESENDQKFDLSLQRNDENDEIMEYEDVAFTNPGELEGDHMFAEWRGSIQLNIPSNKLQPHNQSESTVTLSLMQCASNFTVPYNKSADACIGIAEIALCDLLEVLKSDSRDYKSWKLNLTNRGDDLEVVVSVQGYLMIPSTGIQYNEK